MFMAWRRSWSRLISPWTVVSDLIPGGGLHVARNSYKNLARVSGTERAWTTTRSTGAAVYSKRWEPFFLFHINASLLRVMQKIWRTRLCQTSSLFERNQEKCRCKPPEKWRTKLPSAWNQNAFVLTTGQNQNGRRTLQRTPLWCEPAMMRKTLKGHGSRAKDFLLLFMRSHCLPLADPWKRQLWWERYIFPARIGLGKHSFLFSGIKLRDSHMVARCMQTVAILIFDVRSSH